MLWILLKTGIWEDWPDNAPRVIAENMSFFKEQCVPGLKVCSVAWQDLCAATTATTDLPVVADSEVTYAAAVT